MDQKPSTTLPGVVEKVIPSFHPSVPEQVQISVDDASELYKEIRIENTLTNEKGEEVGLKPGAKVEITVEVDPKDTVKKQD